LVSATVQTIWIFSHIIQSLVYGRLGQPPHPNSALDPLVACSRDRKAIHVLPLSVSFLVTHDTKSHQILDRVIAQTATRLNVVDFESLDRATGLAAPAIALQDFSAELAVGFCVQF